MMKSRSTIQRDTPAFHSALRSDRRFRLDPDVVAAIPAAINQQRDSAMPVRRRAGLLGVIARAFATLQRWRDRAYSRRELAAFDRRMLRDIGVSPYDAGREINKPFWRE